MENEDTKENMAKQAKHMDSLKAGENAFWEGRLLGVSTGFGSVYGDWECRKGHLVSRQSSGCIECSKIMDKERLKNNP
mgnify:CR=1 FL=1